MSHAEQSWPGTAANIREARRFVCRTLAAWDAEEFEWTAAALVSELATNAVLHAGTTFSVAIRLDEGRLRLEVKDGSPAKPVVRNYEDDATTGRGLRLVVQLSEQWGVDPEHKAKTVWCVLALAPPATGSSHDDADVDDLLAQFEDVDPVDSGSAKARSAGSAGRQAA